MLSLFPATDWIDCNAKTIAYHIFEQVYEFVVKTFIKELQIVFYTSKVSNCNGNMEALENKI